MRSVAANLWPDEEKTEAHPSGKVKLLSVADGRAGILSRLTAEDLKRINPEATDRDVLKWVVTQHLDALDAYAVYNDPRILDPEVLDSILFAYQVQGWTSALAVIRSTLADRSGVHALG